jgi:hypothetical protein
VIDRRPSVIERFVERSRRADAIRVNRLAVIATAVIATLVCAMAVGQFRTGGPVNQPIYGRGGGGGGGSVRYGYVGPSAPRSSNLLPSEVRNMHARSGALPSEIRMNYRSIGPAAPGGAAAYIPSGGAVVIRSNPTPAINSANVMAPRVMSSSMSPSIRYNSVPTAMPSAAIRNTAADPTLALSASRSALSAPTMSSNPYGTIRYSTAR